MTTKSILSDIATARRHQARASGHLKIALQTLIALGLPEQSQVGLRAAIQDNATAISYLDDLTRILKLTAPPLKP